MATPLFQWTGTWRIGVRIISSPHIGNYFQNFDVHLILATIFKILLFSKFWSSPHIGDYFQNFTIFKISKFWSSLHIGDPVKLLPLLSTRLNYLYHSLPRRSQIGPDWLIFYFVFCNSYFVFCILFFELFVTQSSSHHILGFSSMACDQYIN